MMSSLPPIALTGTFTRTLSESTIERCTNATSKDELRSLWSQVKDFFLGTHKCEAEAALYDLANATTAKAQLAAFNQLTFYVAPDDLHQLKWHLGTFNVEGFQIGDHRFAATSDTPQFMEGAMPLNFEASCRLLSTLHVNDHHVLNRPEELGLDLESLDRAPKSALHDPQIGRLRVMECQQSLRELPALFDALHVLGMHHDDAEGDLAFDVGQTVELQFSNAMQGETGSVRGRNAERLVQLASQTKSR